MLVCANGSVTGWGYMVAREDHHASVHALPGRVTNRVLPGRRSLNGGGGGGTDSGRQGEGTTHSTYTGNNP